VDAELDKKCRELKVEGLSAELLDDLSNPETIFSLLALFYYDVNKGGFAQFVYNANGVYLPEMAKVLEIIGASYTKAHFDRVIRLCLDRNDEYQEFISGDFSNDNDFKDALHLLSLEYLQSDTRLESEAEIAISEIIKQCENS